jgi:quercetin dioxygenase-like cupin family protein
MNNRVIVRGPGEGRSLLVGAGDSVTYKAASKETDDDYFCFEMTTAPGFGPPLHKHAYREMFYVLEGSFEFTLMREEDRLETITGAAGTFVGMPPYVAHTFKNPADGPARMLCVQQHATLENFFEEFGVPVGDVHDTPDGAGPPDFAQMAAALERNGVTVVAAAEPAR